MKYLLLICFTLTVVACGPQNHAIEIDPIEIDDSIHTVEGEAYTYVVVRFEFITNIENLCSNLHPSREYTDQIERDRVVAQCVFDNLSILNIDTLGEFTNEFCEKDDNYNKLTTEEKIKVDKLCEVL